jgi:hypothetical protein
LYDTIVPHKHAYFILEKYSCIGQFPDVVTAEHFFESFDEKKRNLIFTVEPWHSSLMAIQKVLGT